MKMNKWVSIWGNAISVAENKPESYAKDITLRYKIHVPFGGSKLRLTFDNYCGTEKIEISAVTVMNNGSISDVYFDGKDNVQIGAGENMVSDELDIDTKRGDDLYVSFYFADFTKMRSLVYTQGPLTCGSFAMGNFVHDKEFPAEVSRSTSLTYFLSNVSVYTDSSNRAIVCYGDSITAQNWPEDLQLLIEEHGIYDTAVIRRATSGSRILREYTCITYESYGLMGDKRFNHEVPTDGADTVIIQQGINDIIHPVGTDVNMWRPMSDLPTVEELFDGFMKYVSKGLSYGYKVYGGTLLPIEGWRTYAPFREDMKNEYNDLIRSATGLSGVIDFDKAVRNPEHTPAFLPAFDSGDHLHPSAKGYSKMAEEAFRVLFPES